jgi:flagellar P-ring protein precursor FlgI
MTYSTALIHKPLTSHVMPAQVGIPRAASAAQNSLKKMDSRLRGNDVSGGLTILALIVTAIFAMMPAPAHAARIKDIVSFEGIRDNILVGYGLVVGLNGTGDRLQNNAFTEQSMIGFLERQGVNTQGVKLGSKNVAAVTITAKLPPFGRAGSNIDVSISALGDAKSLLGGTLIATSLSGPDGNVYAVAQGPVTVGGFSAAGNSGTNITKGVPTNGFIPNGAIIEREIDFKLNDLPRVRLSLRNPDVTTANNVMRVINQQLGAGTSKVEDPGTVSIAVPANYKGDVVGLLGDIETLTVNTDQPARIVVDEATGTIVMGENVRISTVAVAQGNLIVKVEETPQVSQPNPFAPAGAETVEVPRTDVTISEQNGNKIAVLQEGATLKDMVTGLNALGVGPRDLITILQTIKAAGALQADIETR